MSHKGKSVAANTTHQRGIRGSVARADTRPFEHVVKRADIANSVIDHRLFPSVCTVLLPVVHLSCLLHSRLVHSLDVSNSGSTLLVRGSSHVVPSLQNPPVHGRGGRHFVSN